MPYNPKIPIVCGLINFWPFNGNYSDLIGGADLYGGTGFSLSNDRNGNQSSSMYINQGYRSVPSGVYFNSDFTVTFLLHVNAFDSSLLWSTILDFGNGVSNNNIYIGLQDTVRIRSVLFQYAYHADTNSPTDISLNQWIFISVVLKQSTLMIYYNGALQVTTGAYYPYYIQRNNNFFGYDYWCGKGDFKIEDLKIFNRALNETEILIEKNSVF